MLKNYYLASTEPRLRAALNEVLIQKHMEALQTSFSAMIKDEKYEDMKRTYYLLSRITEGLNQTAKTLEDYLVNVGIEIVRGQEKKNQKEAIASAASFIRSLIEMQKKYTQLLTTCFSNHSLFKAALDKAFTSIMNAPTGKWTMPRLLTMFIDHILKGKEKESASDADIDDILDQVVQLFSYISDKDEFEEISRKALCKRLLNTSSKFNENWERSFVAKLKARHGDAFTRRLQGMFNDSQDETIARMRKKFEEWNGGDKVGGIALSLQVLSGCFWPLSPADKIPITALPPELSNCVSRFEEFYKIDTQNRKLRWIYNHGSVNINGNYGKGKLLQFVMSPLQACILLLFNNQDTYTFEEIFKYLWPGEKMGSKINSFVDVKLDDQLRYALGPLISGGKLTIKIFLLKLLKIQILLNQQINLQLLNQVLLKERE